MKHLISHQPAIEDTSDNASPRRLRSGEGKSSKDDCGLRCEVISEFSRLEELSSDWERLWQADPKAEVFQAFAWARAWWQSYGDHFEMCTPVMWEGDEVVGILPLVKRESIVQFLGTPEADYADMLCEEGREAEVLTAALRALLHSVEQWDECILKQVAKEGRIQSHIQELPRDLSRRLQVVPVDSYQTIFLQENREQIFNSLLGKHHTRRRQNKLKKAGQVNLRRLVSKSEAQQHLNHFFLHHTRRCALLGRESSCSRAENRQFLRAVVEGFDPTGGLRFEVMELDGHPFAWHFSFLVKGKFLLYQHTFDLNSWDYAPGEVLLSNLLKFAQENVAREFDFGSGDEAYKSRFARHTREMFSIYVEPEGLGGKVRGLLRASQACVFPLVSRLKQKAKTHTSTFRLLRSIRIWMSGNNHRIRQARQAGTLLKYGLHKAAQLFRNIVWGREDLYVFPWETLAGSVGRPSSESCHSNEVEIGTAGFGDLVDAATERPDAIVAYQLSGFRQRLKKGDQAYIGRKLGDALILAWTSTNNADDLLSRKESSASRPTLAMYESWAVRGLNEAASYRQLLSVLRSEAAFKKLDLLILVRGDQKLLQTEVEHQGVRPQYRVARYSLFHWLRWTRTFHTKQTVADPLLAGAARA